MFSYLLRISVLLASFTLIACSEESAPETAKADVVSEGEIIVKQNCKVCHAQGINGAPVIGNQKMWASRSGQGIETLVSHAIAGYGLMPPKGGKTHLTDEQITLAVTYMLDQLP